MTRKLLLSAIAIALLFGCSKRYLKWDTVLDLVIPESCINCQFVVGNKKLEKEGSLSHPKVLYTEVSNSANANLSYSAAYPSTRLRIQWKDIQVVDPAKEKITFAVIDEFGVVRSTLLNLKPRKKYYWDANSFDTEPIVVGKLDSDEKNIIEDNNGNTSSGSSPLQGKWSQVDGCSNSQGDKNYFIFNADGSGTILQADCNNFCGEPGVFTYFSYTDNGSSVSINPNSVSNFCGTNPTLASSFTASYSISGSILILDGQTFEK